MLIRLNVLCILNDFQVDELFTLTLILCDAMGGQVWLLHEISVPLPLDYQGALLHLAYKATFISLLRFERTSYKTT